MDGNCLLVHNAMIREIYNKSYPIRDSDTKPVIRQSYVFTRTSWNKEFIFAIREKHELTDLPFFVFHKGHWYLRKIETIFQININTTKI